MLYNILPPTILTLSLGGIIVIVSRAAMRVRQESFAADVKSAEEQVVADASDFLKPSQESVHAIKSRLVLFKMMLAQTKTGFVSSWAHIVHKFHRQPREAVVEESVEEPRQSFINRLQDVSGRVTAATGDRFESLCKKVSSIKIKKSAAPMARIVNSVKKSAIRTKLVSTPTDEELTESVTPVAAAVTATPTPMMTATMTTARSIMRRHKTVANDLRSAQEALGNSEYQKAEDILVTYIVKHTKDTDAYMLLGQVALGRGDWEGAIEIFEQVVNWSAKQEGAYAALGHAAYKAGHFKQSLVALQRAREAEPGNSAVLQELLDIAQKMDNRALQHSLQEDLEQVQKNSEEENSHAAV